MTHWHIEPNSFNVVRFYGDHESEVDLCFHPTAVWVELAPTTNLTFHSAKEIDTFIKHFEKAKEQLEK